MTCGEVRGGWGTDSFTTRFTNLICHLTAHSGFSFISHIYIPYTNMMHYSVVIKTFQVIKVYSLIFAGTQKPCADPSGQNWRIGTCMINLVTQLHFKHYSDYWKTEHMIKVCENITFAMHRGISGTLLASQTVKVCDGWVDLRSGTTWYFNGTCTNSATLYWIKNNFNIGFKQKQFFIKHIGW